MTDGEDSEKSGFLAKAESFLAEELHLKAQDLALKWLERFPHDAEARTIVCHAWTRLGKLDKVKRMLAEVDETILGISQIYVRMGDICRQSGLNQEAESFYRRFVTINPEAEMTQSVAEKLRALSLSGDEGGSPEEERAEETEGEKRLLPGLQTVTLAELYFKQGHPGVAVEMLEEILKRDGTNERALTVLRSIRGDSVAQAPGDLPLKAAAVIGELNRWLNNIDRMRVHAA